MTEKYGQDVQTDRGFVNDLDWKKAKPEYAWSVASDLHYRGNLFKVVNESFMDKLAEHICDLKKAHMDNKKMKDIKFRIPMAEQMFSSMTIDQLDLIKSLLSKRQYEIMQDSNYVSAYFSKLFCDELSEENKELLNDE
jgi:hypothetical protein